MIAKLIELLERIEPTPSIWLVIYCPTQGQFTVSHSKEECKINSRLLKEGRFAEMNPGFYAGYADTEQEAVAQIPEIAEKLNLQWSEKEMKWNPK